MRKTLCVAALALFVLEACAPKTAPPSPPPPVKPAAAPGARPPILAEIAEPAPLSGKAFKPTCDVPFGSIGKVQDIDDECGIEGSGSAKSKLQNAAKNNFCAEGPTVDLNRRILERLQNEVDSFENFPWGSPTNIPEDRSRLKAVTTVSGKPIGEGTRVRVRAYFMHANYSNVSGGEAVNCSVGGEKNNDIHIYLALTPEEDDKCESLNAEISPHFRPKAWLDIVDLEISQKRPLRITGHLFFDASHQPCRVNKRHSPNRFTSWEIHPIYNIEVCKFKSASSCPLNGGADKWIPFDEWVGEGDEHGPGGDK
jgi:hypothetical protein